MGKDVEKKIDRALDLTFPASDPPLFGDATGTEKPARPVGRRERLSPAGTTSRLQPAATRTRRCGSAIAASAVKACRPPTMSNAPTMSRGSGASAPTAGIGDARARMAARKHLSDG